MSRGPLTGIRVVEFANLVAGPYAGMLLADLGADVVKVETPAGDLARGFGPYLDGESAFFLAVNRGKRSIALDPKHPAARSWLDRLVGGADVVLHNLRRGAMERMGYGEDRVREMNPKVVYAVVSAFGPDGPYADRAGIDVIFQAESGMVSITGHPDDPPQKTATTIGDYVAATNAALAICAALFEREREGRGRRVDVSLRDGLLAVQSGWWVLYFASGRQPERTGTASPFLAPNQIFPTADGHMALAIVSDRHFAILCEELGRPDLSERYPTNADRMEGRNELIEALTAIFTTDTTEAWVERLDAAGLPVGRVLDFAGVEADPQIAHNEMVAEWDHPKIGKVKGIGSPMRVDGTAARAETAPPALGQHTREVLEELGAPPAEVDRLAAEGAVVIS
ncbi:MAG TPA: CoA transferase [Acidimicrobiia bacterium]|jgi:crotonobetainyl-CoA:carnitine CoA-transferase CaiB-like acyl-CoA transferase